MKPGSCAFVALLCAVLGACGTEPEAPAAPGSASGRFSVGQLLGETDDGLRYAQADSAYRLRFPEDHGPHPRFRSEWWYLTLNLEDAAGAQYGGQFTVFRQALPAALSSAVPAQPWAASQIYLGHLAMTDVAAGRHRFAERFSRGLAPLAGSRAVPFAVWLDDWRLESLEDGFLPLRLVAAAPAFAWDLTLLPGKARVLQGEAGYSPKGPGQASHYYSYTRLPVRGTLRQGEETVTVSGTGWLDREWSTSVLSAGQTGWDWFALQLRDGRDLMLFNLRRKDCGRDPFDHGVIVHPDGRSEHLPATRFTLTPIEEWSPELGDRWRPVAGCRAQHWPLAWRVQLDDEQFVVRAAVSDQRMLTAVRYWEGLVRVLDAQGERELGRGYLELTGY